DPKLAWIGYVARKNADDGLPTIAAAALEALRQEPAPPLDRKQLDGALAGSRQMFAWFKLCLDETGALSRIEARGATSIAALDVFEPAIRGWKLRPFQIDGQPMPVCAMIALAHPDDPRPIVMPFPV